MHLSLKNVCVDIDGRAIIQDVSFSLKKGQVGCLLGASGCGKTTLLRAICGLHPMASGNITLNKEKLTHNGGIVVRANRRNIGLVFQHNALFSHINAEQNIKIGADKDQNNQALFIKLINILKLEDILHRYPYQLSGGQQKRVALARSIMPQPQVLLLDEPFSGLDDELGQEVRPKILQLLKQMDITTLIVTHNQDEMFSLSEVVGVLNQSKLEQWANAYTIYHEPATKFVADFIGRGVFLRGIALDAKNIKTELGTLHGKKDKWQKNQPLEVLIRPDDVAYKNNSSHKGIIKQSIFYGANMLYTLKLPSGAELEMLTPSHQIFAIDEEIGITLDLDHLVAF